MESLQSIFIYIIYLSKKYILYLILKKPGKYKILN